MPWIIRKAFFAAFALWVVVSLAFGCLYLLPGDPARLILGPQASTAAVAEFRSRAGLDQSMGRRYLRYITGVLRGDLGHSFAARRPVGELLVQRCEPTIALALGASFWVALFGVVLPLTTVAYRWAPGLVWLERALHWPAIAPPYALGTVGLLLFAGWLKWAPITFESVTLRSLWLPALVLAVSPAALVARLFSRRVLQEMNDPYVQRARAQGFSTAWIAWREAGPNALTSACAGFANSLAYFVTGTFFVEVIFGIPGLGRLAQEALRQGDVAVLAGVCLLFSTAMLAISLLLDAVQAWLDPKARERGHNAA